MVSARGLAKDYGIFKSSTHRILAEDLGLYAYKVQIEPKLAQEQKKKIRLLV